MRGVAERSMGIFTLLIIASLHFCASVISTVTERNLNSPYAFYPVMQFATASSGLMTATYKISKPLNDSAIFLIVNNDDINCKLIIVYYDRRFHRVLNL